MAAGLNLQPQTVNGLLFLDLSNRGLTSIPEEVFDITDLQYLDVSNNKLTSIPEAIGRLQKLYRLDADGNKLTSLPQAIGSLQELKQLYVHNNNLCELPDGLEALNKLEWLFLQKLRKLGINGNQLTEVPPGVCFLSDIEVLDASNNKLSTLPPGVEKLQKLRKLGINGNQLTEVPPEVCSLSNLEVLDASNNKLSTLPPGVEKLQKLRELYIYNNQLTEVPPGVCSLSNLDWLNVSNNKLSTLPPGLEKLQKLTHLLIKDNQLTEAPPGVCSLSNLEVLNVGGNPIRRLPDDVRRLTRLKSLDVAGCQFEEFPRQVLQLKTLEKLYAGGCKFDTVPDEVGTLQHLWFLALDNNLLRTLPSTMSHLHNLREVHLDGNKFDTFPEVLCELPAMEKLDISHNNITKLPTALHRADKLRDLDVSGNPLTYPPQDVCEQGTSAIMTFMNQEAEKDEEILQAFNRLSVKVKQTQWKPLARSLGLSKRAIDAIKASAPDDVPDQVYQTLVQWKLKEGEAATLPALQQHLRELDFHQLAEQLPQTPRTPTRRGHGLGGGGAVGGQGADELQNSRFPSVTVDRKFPIIHYERLEEQSILGRGGFAYVMKARHLDWRQDVAVKCLWTRELEGSEQEVLYSEARKLKLASKSDHVISLLGVCLDPNFAIVMPYMENGSLAGLLRDVDVPWALRWRMAHEISLGMTFLHCQNPQILHCDLKAENVLLDGDFRVKISDFGLSKWKIQSRVVTQTSPEGSTITHAPPEYFLDINLAPTPKFDVYSFGVLLWEMITRADPYGNAINSALIRLAVTSGQRPDMTLVPTDPPDVIAVSQLMQTCWSQNPEDRPTFQALTLIISSQSADVDMLESEPGGQAYIPSSQSADADMLESEPGGQTYIPGSQSADADMLESEPGGQTFKTECAAQLQLVKDRFGWEQIQQAIITVKRMKGDPLSGYALLYSGALDTKTGGDTSYLARMTRYYGHVSLTSSSKSRRVHSVNKPKNTPRVPDGHSAQFDTPNTTCVKGGTNSIGRRPEGDPTRGRAGTEGDAEYTVLAQAGREKRVRTVLWKPWKRSITGSGPGLRTGPYRKVRPGPVPVIERYRGPGHRGSNMAAGLNLQPQRTVDGLLALDLSNQGLTYIPEEVFDLTDLEVLDVSNNKLTSIPEAIGRLQKLRQLGTNSNKLTSLPQAIGSLQELTMLLIYDNQLTEIPSGVCSLSNLEVLGANKNKLSTLPAGVEKLQKLTKLHIRDNQLTEVPPGVCSLSNLEVLNVSNNKLSTLPPGVKKLQKLRQLYINGNQLTEVPPGVCSLSNLEVLDVSNNKLFTLPPGVEKLQKLRELRIECNKLTEVPPGACSLSNLQVLSVSNNKLTTLPHGVEKLQKLRQLGINGNQLTEVPPGVCSLSNLEVLTVSNNKLSTLPPGVEKLRKLTKLFIDGNQLTEVPPGVCSLSNLEVLGVSNNKLSTLPPGVEKLQKLRELDINGNQLTEVPPGVCSLSNLEVLIVGPNPIRCLPDDVRRLTRLKTLDVVRCQFEEFPRQVLQLKTLEELYAGECKFDTVPDEVGTLQHLWFLSLENNLLRTLPSTMSHLHNLREVYLYGNKFDTFPEVLCELPAMEKLHIRKNNITRLPTALHRADKLKDLDVSGNPLTYPPQDVCAEGTGTIMAFLKQEAEKEILQTFNRLSVKVKQTQWKPLARSLGFNDSEIGAIKASAPDDVPEQVYQTLVQWREKEGEAATLPALQQHLRDLGFHQLAELLPQTPGEERPKHPSETDNSNKVSGSHPVVVMLNDEYGTAKGGISTIHRQMGRFLVSKGAKVYSTVLEATPQDKEDAKNDGVNLIFPTRHEGDPTKPGLNWLTWEHGGRYPNLPADVDFIVGHVNITSRAARKIKEDRIPDAKVVQVTHVIPENVAHYKVEGRELSIEEEKESIKEDLKDADVIVSVGPRLYDYYRNETRDEERNKEFLPEPSEIFVNTDVTYLDTETKVVLSIGRVKGVERLKGYDLAGKTMVKVIERLPDTIWRVCGIRHEDFPESKALIQANMKRGKIHFTPLKYCTQAKLCEEMSRAHVVLMPSREEPFGLVGLEAIAAGVPALVSNKSGLAKFLRKYAYFKGPIVKIEDEDDKAAQTLAERIIDILENGEREFDAARKLKETLLASRYWDASHSEFAKIFGLN
ncbi:hypothetical protein Bbelb_328340 [Branchiostoma belcheri]|nr:hypothetical protein Bbelb_328340 [Branchiostoma belcheri]